MALRVLLLDFDFYNPLSLSFSSTTSNEQQNCIGSGRGTRTAALIHAENYFERPLHDLQSTKAGTNFGGRRTLLDTLCTLA